MSNEVLGRGEAVTQVTVNHPTAGSNPADPAKPQVRSRDRHLSEFTDAEIAHEYFRRIDAMFTSSVTSEITEFSDA